MNCEDIVRRKYKQRLQQNIHIFFFENLNLVIFFCFNFFGEFTEINNKKYTPFYLSCIQLAKYFSI